MNSKKGGTNRFGNTYMITKMAPKSRMLSYKTWEVTVENKSQTALLWRSLSIYARWISRTIMKVWQHLMRQYLGLVQKKNNPSDAQFVRWGFAERHRMGVERGRTKIWSNSKCVPCFPVSSSLRPSQQQHIIHTRNCCCSEGVCCAARSVRGIRFESPWASTLTNANGARCRSGRIGLAERVGFDRRNQRSLRMARTVGSEQEKDDGGRRMLLIF